jgi:hypothetical protein
MERTKTTIQKFTKKAQFKPVRTSVTMTNFFFLLFVIQLLWLTMFDRVYGQEMIGTDICFCQPTVYEFTIDLSLSCNVSSMNNTVLLPGINETSCITMGDVNASAAAHDENNEIRVTKVTYITIAEYNFEGETTGVASYTDELRHGDSIQYTSSIVPSITDEDWTMSNITHTFTLTMLGYTDNDERITNSWFIDFTNDCQSYPVISNGLSIGWTTLVSKYTTPPIVIVDFFYFVLLLFLNISHVFSILYFLFVILRMAYNIIKYDSFIVFFLHNHTSNTQWIHSQ